MCDYKFEDGTQCKEKPLSGSKYCILHTPFPEDRDSEEFKRIAKLKEEKVKEKVKNGDFNFEGAVLLSVDFSGMEINSDVNFNNAVILGYVTFDGSTIEKGIMFEESTIKGDVSFNKAIIKSEAYFNRSVIDGDVWFEEATIKGSMWFNGDEIKGFVWFPGAVIKAHISFDASKIGSYVWFSEAKIGGFASFKRIVVQGSFWFDGAIINDYAWFDEARIMGDVWFSTLTVKGGLSLKRTAFKSLQAEENACRAARRSYEKLGDRETADEYFLREMRARRRRKNKIAQFLEWMIADFTCRYGTDFLRPVLIWLILVLGVFPSIYYSGHGIAASHPLFSLFPHAEKSFASAEYFSVVTATTLGYGDLQPALTTLWHIPIFRALASLEAIFGTFMWVIFLTVFALKYMK